MIYAILKIVMRFALSVYFRKLHVKGLENIPKDGPFLIVANHPSSFLDPISIAIFVNKKISFLAKATIFSNKIAAKILYKLNIVPIYRAQDNPEKLKENKAVFSACYEKLSKKGIIMIFPEGTSENERKLRPIKTGAARIALGTTKENNYDLNVKILPVGLNYTKSSTFRSELSIEFGTPIETNDYVEDFKHNETQTTRNLTTDIEKSIKDLIINIDTKECDELVEKVEKIYKTELAQKNSLPVNISQKIAEEAQLQQANAPDVFNDIRYKIDNYFEKLEQFKVSDQNIGQKQNSSPLLLTILKSVLKIILGFPVWLIGFIHSYLPYKLTRSVALLITKDQAFYGALLMSVGTSLFMICYGLSVLSVWWIFKIPLLTLLHVISLPFLGFFTIYYARLARKFYYNWKFISCFYNRKQVILELMLERKHIIQQLENIRKYSEISRSH